VLFYCDPYCDAFATVWLTERSVDAGEGLQRLRGKQIPKPRPEPGDKRLVLTPATEMSVDTWRAITGTPHPEPGNGMMLAESDEVVKKDFRRPEPVREIKPRALWVDAGATFGRRSVSGSDAYQRGFASPRVVGFKTEICTLWQKNSRYGACLDAERTRFENEGAFEQRLALGLRWGRRIWALKHRGFDFRVGAEKRSSAAPVDDPLNTASSFLGVAASVESLLSYDSPEWEPHLRLGYFRSFKGSDSDNLRGDAIGYQAFAASLQWRLRTPLVFTIHGAEHGLAVLPRVAWSRAAEKPSGVPRNPFFPRSQDIAITRLQFEVSLLLEELSW
jgi:hypothetical protein